MYISLLCYLIIAFTFIVFGKSFLLHFDKQEKDNYSVFDSFFIGLCLIGTLLNTTSLFLPTDLFLLLFLLLSVVFLFYKSRRYYIPYFKSLWRELKSDKLLFFLILAAVLITLLYALVTPRNYDSYLYHINAIQWNEMYRAVPGLANFHDRFGFNSSIFVLSAVFSFSSIYNQSLFLISALCYLVFFIWIIKLAYSQKGIVGLFLIVFLFFLTQQYANDISSPGTDLLPNLLVGYVLLSLLFDKESLKKKSLFYIIIPLFCVTLKISVLPIVIVSLIAVYVKNKNFLKTAIQFSVFGSLLILPWVVKNVILSGYLVYPISGLDLFNVDWKVSPESVIEIKKWITSWARIPLKNCDEVLSMPFSQWFPIWWEALLPKNKIFFTLAVVSPIFMGIVAFLNRQKETFYFYLLPFIVAFCCFILWFFSAPDIRFSFVPLLFLALFPLLMLETLIHKFSKRFNLVLFLFGFYLLFLIGNNGYVMFCEDYRSLENVAKYCYLPKDVSEVKEDRYIEYNTIELMNNQGKKIKLYIPNPDHSQCFDKFPCSWYFIPSIKLRGDDLQDGFKL